MGNIFAGSEIIEFGIQIEKNGRDFYNALTKKTKDDKVRDIFVFLASEEERHIEVFKKILNKVERYEPSESYPGEYFAYMNALAGEYVFTRENKGEEMARNITTDIEAINLGIGFEKESIIFYEGMKRMVLESEQAVIDELIQQEQEHLRRLISLKAGLKGI